MPVTEEPKLIVSAASVLSALAAKIASRSEMPSARRRADQRRDRRDSAVDNVVRVADRDIRQQPPVFQRLESQPTTKRE